MKTSVATRPRPVTPRDAHRSRGTTGYTTIRELRRATMATVREEIGAKLGRSLTDGDVAHIVSRVGSARFWEEYRFAEDGFGKAETSLRAALDALPDLARLPEAARAVATVAELQSIRDRLESCAKELRQAVVPGGWKRSGRSILADPLVFRGAMWWWGPKGASNRDRALVSLLAGHWPAVAADEEVTPELVIQQEANAIGEARRRLKKRRPT